MATSVTVYSYGNLDALTGIFNAIAMVMGGNDYKDAIRLSLMLGFGIAAINAVAQQHRSWHWVITVIVIYQVLLGSGTSTTVVLQDKTGGVAARSVSNVPYALAFFAQLKSGIGWVLTDTFDTAFQTIPTAGVALPPELGYSKNGLMFGNSLIRASRGADFVDPDVRTDVVAFFQNCTVPDLMDGTISSTAFFESGDIWSAAGPGNPSRFTTVHVPSVAGVQNMACPLARLSIFGRLPAQTTTILQKLGSQLYPALPAATAVSQLTAALPAAYIKFGIANAAATASDLVLQNAMLNLFAETGQLMNLSASDPGAVMMSVGLAQGVASANASFMAQGRIAEQALPIIRNVVEGIIYAMFPVIVLLMLMSEGDALKNVSKNYLYALLWLELWPVLYTVVNFIGTSYSAANVRGSAMLASGGKALALNTASQIYSTTISDMAVVGWMTLSIPVIAGAVIWGMDRLQSAVNLGGFLGSIGSSAGQAAQGNVGMGNVSLEQQNLAPTRTSANMRVFSDAYGTQYSDISNGTMRYDTRTGSSPVNIQYSKQEREQFAAMSAHEQALGEGHTKQANASITAAYNDAKSLLRDSGKQQQLGDRYGFGKLGNDGLSAENRQQVASQLAKDLKIQDDSKFQEAMKLGLTAPGLIAKLSPLTAGGSGQKATDEQISAAVSKARNHAEQLSTANMVSVVDNFTHSKDFGELTSTNQRAAHNIQSGLDQAKGYQKSASVNFTDAQKYQERAEKALALSRGWTASDTVAWNNFLNEKGILGTGLETDIRRMAPLVDEFLDRGSLASDGKGGFMFVSGHGEGPNIPTRLHATTNAPGADGKSSLKTTYESKTPTAPSLSSAEARQIRNQKAANDTAVGGEWSKAGVRNPDGAPLAGNDVKAEVDNREQVALGKADSVAPVVQGEKNNLDGTLATREERLSENHHPWGTEGGKVFSEYSHVTTVDGKGNSKNSVGIADPLQQIAQERAQKTLAGTLPKMPRSGDRIPTHATLSPEQRREKQVEMASLRNGAQPNTYTKVEGRTPTIHLTPEQRQEKIQRLLRERENKGNKP